MLFDVAVEFIVILMMPFYLVHHYGQRSAAFVRVKVRSLALSWRMQGRSKEYAQMVRLRLMRMYLREMPETREVRILNEWCEFEIERRKACGTP